MCGVGEVELLERVWLDACLDPSAGLSSFLCKSSDFLLGEAFSARPRGWMATFAALLRYRDDFLRRDHNSLWGAPMTQMGEGGARCATLKWGDGEGAETWTRMTSPAERSLREAIGHTATHSPLPHRALPPSARC